MVRLTTYERAIRLQNKPILPRDIIESDLSLQSYLAQNVIDNRQDEKVRQQIAKTKRTWISKRLELAARNIKIEPATISDAEPTKLTKSWKCKKVEAPTTTAAPLESNVVEETRRGLRVTCTHCGHSFTHFSKNLYSQYFCSCSRL
jgi:RNase P subunit RPR2